MSLGEQQTNTPAPGGYGDLPNQTMSRIWHTLFQRLYIRESAAGHDLFCPPELVRAQILLALESRGPCDIRTLEVSTSVAPEYLLEEVFNLGEQQVLKVERRFKKRLLRKPKPYLWVALKTGRMAKGVPA